MPDLLTIEITIVFVHNAPDLVTKYITTVKDHPPASPLSTSLQTPYSFLYQALAIPCPLLGGLQDLIMASHLVVTWIEVGYVGNEGDTQYSDS